MKNFHGIEFSTCESEVWYRVGDVQKKLTESDPIVKELLEDIENFYPEAHKALEKWFKQSSGNIPYYRFLRVEQFCKCNFGVSEPHTQDICSRGKFNFERVPCPMRGRCAYEEVVCSPRFNSRISAAEMRVLELMCDGWPFDEIGDKLCISPYTSRNHKRRMMVRLGLRKDTELVAYALKHHLIMR